MNTTFDYERKTLSECYKKTTISLEPKKGDATAVEGEGEDEKIMQQLKGEKKKGVVKIGLGFHILYLGIFVNN